MIQQWYYRITNDLSIIPDFISYYDDELKECRKELSLKGNSIERHAADLPGIVEFRYSQLQEIEAVLEFLNIQLRKDRSVEFKKFLESYNKALSSRDAEKYIDGVSSIVAMSLLINEVALLRNRYLGITKAMEQKSFMLGHISKLRIAGMEDSVL